MTEFDNDENAGRKLFKTYFSKYFKTLWFADDRYSWFDCSGETRTHKTLFEIKNRQRYRVADWTGSTYIEKHKRDKFREFYEENRDFDLIYICFYKDGWVSFDVNNRIKATTSEWLATYVKYLPSTTSINTGYREKEVAELRYNNNDYNDKIGYYESS